MKPSLHILHLEDSLEDAVLIETLLREDGVTGQIDRVQSKEEFMAALKRGGIDLILSDFSLPAFDGLSALKLARGTCPEVPFLFVSGALGEEVAIDSLRRGATDYVLKHKL